MPSIHETELRQVENRLYHRMLRNTAIGFMRSALVGAVVGLALGTLVATGIGAGLIPALPFIAMHGTGLVAALGIGAQWALGFASVAGGFGAVAGIQSTRDGRRYLELDTISKETAQDSIPDRMPDHARVPAIAQDASLAQGAASFTERVEQQHATMTQHQR